MRRLRNRALLSPGSLLGLLILALLLFLFIAGLTLAVAPGEIVGEDEEDRDDWRGFLRPLFMFLPRPLRRPAVRALGVFVALTAMGVIGEFTGLREAGDFANERIATNARAKEVVADRVRSYGERLVAHARAVGSPFDYELDGEHVVVFDANESSFHLAYRDVALEERPLDLAFLEIEALVRGQGAVPIPRVTPPEETPEPTPSPTPHPPTPTPRSPTEDADLLVERARARWEAGDIDASILLAERALEIYERKLPVGHETTARTRAMLDAAHEAAKKKGAAP